ncbi:hypothetical protein ACE6H2_002113 [Prunus campanulata]
MARSPLAQSLFLHWFYCLQKGLLFKSFIKLIFHFDACLFLILSVLDRVGVRFFVSCWILLLLIYFSRISVLLFVFLISKVLLGRQQINIMEMI